MVGCLYVQADSIANNFEECSFSVPTKFEEIQVLQTLNFSSLGNYWKHTPRDLELDDVVDKDLDRNIIQCIGLVYTQVEKLIFQIGRSYVILGVVKFHWLDIKS